MKTHARALGPHPAYPPRASVHKVVSWCVPHPSYAPVLFTHPSVLGAAWADKEFATMTAQERVQLSDRPSKVGRQSSRKVSTLAWMGFVHKSGVPRNPVGRTGMHGRGLLERYGANFAADPIVTRRKPTDPTVLQMVTITRRDTGELAIPVGMVEYGETVSQTLRKEFYEEALRSEEGNDNMTAELQAKIDAVFDKGGALVYAGYVDDPRNTDDAWMETEVRHFHLDDDLAAQIPLEAGDDAGHVAWEDLTPEMRLYASHKDWVDVVRHRSRSRAFGK